MNITDWLKTQYGPGRRFPSARALSLEISEGRNPNLVADILVRGTVARCETLRQLARACQVNPVYLAILIIGPGEPDLQTELLVYQSPDEARLVQAFRRLDPLLRRAVLAGVIAAADASAPPGE